MKPGIIFGPAHFREKGHICKAHQNQLQSPQDSMIHRFSSRWKKPGEFEKYLPCQIKIPRRIPASIWSESQNAAWAWQRAANCGCVYPSGRRWSCPCWVPDVVFKGRIFHGPKPLWVVLIISWLVPETNSIKLYTYFFFGIWLVAYPPWN